MSLTQPEIYRQVQALGTSKIKELTGRKRLRFTTKQIAFYLWILYQQHQQKVHFKGLYEQNPAYGLSYGNWMENLNLFAPLVKFLFKTNRQKLGIKPSKLLNIIDSTLLPEKAIASIKSHDYQQNRVTWRDRKPICGSKGLVLLNRQGQITFAKLLEINCSDLNLLKRPAWLASNGYLQGFLLADRGFNCKLVRERLAVANRAEAKGNLKPTRLLSPYHYKEKLQLRPKEWKLYRRRWKIETVFQQLKDEFGRFKLNLKKNLRRKLKEAEFFFALIDYNYAVTA